MSIVFLVHFILSNQHLSYLSPKNNNILESNETECIYDTSYSQNIITNNIICIIRCKFESIISASVGGAIAVSLRNSFGQNSVIDDCKFIKCKSNNGGAVYFNIQKNSLTQIMNTLFELNSAYSKLSNLGGAIYITSEIENDFEINNCSFYSNSAHSSVSNSSATSLYNYGGAIFISTKVSCYFKIEKCLFLNNSVYSSYHYYLSEYINYGGSIYIKSQNNDNIQLYNCTFISNRAKDYGGCIFFNSVQYLIDKCDFVNNSINSSNYNECQGGSIYASISNGTMHECSFINNSVNSEDSSGGAISFSISNGVFEYCNFTNNYINSKKDILAKYGHGGAIFIAPPVERSFIDAKYSFLKCIFNNNSVYTVGSNANGGAISFFSTFLHINSKSMSHCSINECSFINNKVKTDNYRAFGGAISFDYIMSKYPNVQKCVSYSTEIINKTIFENNIAYSSKNNAYGGAISNYYLSASMKTVFDSNTALDQCVFINNTVYSGLGDIYGGAFSHLSLSEGENDYHHGTFKNCIFNNNNVYSISNSSYGGAISFNRLYGSFNNCTFYNNIAETFLNIYLYEGDEPRSLGGAIYSENSNIEYEKCYFINNTGYGNATKHISTGKGGAIFSEKSSNSIYNSTFINNTLCNYGLKYDIDCYINGGACYFSNSDAKVFGCNFIKNKAIIHVYESSYYFSARTYGGAIYSTNSNYQILNCLNCLFESNFISISENHQKEFAGAICLTNGIIENCVFNDNTAYNGGDIRYDQNEYSSLYIERCHFNHYNTIDSNQIKSLIHIRVNNDSSNINKFIHNKVILNITTVLFDGKIEERVSLNKILKIKFSFDSNCITPFDEKYYKTDSIMIYNVNGVEYAQFNSVFQSDCDDYIDSMTQTTEMETQTKQIETHTKEIETHTKEIETQTKEVETKPHQTQTNSFVTQTGKVQTQFISDISEKILENSQTFTYISKYFTTMEQPTIAYTEQAFTESINGASDDSKNLKKNKIIFIILTGIIVFQTILIIGLILFIVIKRKNKEDLIHHSLLDDNNLTSIF